MPRGRTPKQALAWGPWSDSAAIVGGAVAARAGDRDAAERAWTPVRERIAPGAAPPEYASPQIATGERVHALPAVERRLLQRFAGP